MVMSDHTHEMCFLVLLLSCALGCAVSSQCCLTNAMSTHELVNARVTERQTNVHGSCPFSQLPSIFPQPRMRPLQALGIGARICLHLSIRNNLAHSRSQVPSPARIKISRTWLYTQSVRTGTACARHACRLAKQHMNVVSERPKHPDFSGEEVCV